MSSSRTSVVTRVFLWAVLLATSVQAQIWQPTGDSEVYLDRQALDQVLQGAPWKSTGSQQGGTVPGATALIPVQEDGRLKLLGFTVEETPVLAPLLAVAYPGIRSYAGESVTDPRRRLRLTVTPDRVHGLIFEPSGAASAVSDPSARAVELWAIEISDGDPSRSLYQVAPALGGGVDDVPFTCGTTELVMETQTKFLSTDPAAGSDAPPRHSQGLRTYRLALATTAEFSANNGGSVESVLGVLAATINGLNEIYERDLGTRFEIVPETVQTIFLDRRDQPFTATTGDEFLVQSQALFDCAVGHANYDLGHTLNTLKESTALQPSVGLDPYKGQGTTGVAAANGRGVDLTYLAHEIGHQFGAGHTYTGTFGDCSKDNFQKLSAVEPRSGSTLMSYAGLCKDDDLQENSSLYFHATSLRQMFVERHNNAYFHPPVTSTGNRVPSIEAGKDIDVPHDTEFKLQPTSFSDPDSDHLTWTWEQTDLSSDQIPSGSTTCPAAYLSIAPSPLEAQNNPGGSGDCQRTFTATARDNNLPGGGVVMDFRIINFRSDVGPFVIRQPKQDSTHQGKILVTWDVAKTDTELKVEKVRIILHCDKDPDGNWHALEPMETENDGKFTVDLNDDLACLQAYVEVQAVNHVFFATSGLFFIERPTKEPKSAN